MECNLDMGVGHTLNYCSLVEHTEHIFFVLALILFN